MAFDSGMLSAVVYEVNKIASNARVDKINQPEKAELVFTLRTANETVKLCISATPGSPRICFEKEAKENPKTAPSLCMSFRKHLSGSKLNGCRLMGFERIVRFDFTARDEMGYLCEKYLYVEIMGKSSGFILCDENGKIITASRFVDISANAERKILPGIKYEMPPKQDKADTLSTTEEEFVSRIDNELMQSSAEAYLRNTYMGIAPLVSREIVYSACRNTEASIAEVGIDRLWKAFFEYTQIIKNNDYCPCLVRAKDGKNIDFCFIKIKQYQNDADCIEYPSVSELVEDYFKSKNKAETEKHYAHDLFVVMQNARQRVARKLIMLEKELAECAKKEHYKLCGDLITANMYAIKKGDKSVDVQNYFDADCPMVKVELDIRLTPAQNAQNYYKKYAKLKSGEHFKTEQIKKANAELEYIESVIDCLERSKSDDDYGHIREELIGQGYIKKSNIPQGRKLKSNMPVKYVMPSGRIVYCGKNNVQNDYIDSKLAEKNDIWFHVKNYAGSHVVLVCNGTEPSDEDYTLAARFAAYNSKQRGKTGVAVDYTRVKNLKKPSGAVPGYVTYLTNYTAYVDATDPNLREL